ncbi:MAG TPA: hypothetical protein VE870_08875 [Bacteroidales bacterium]|nr:hypothetical protein [Bacteroidales bacterium]
MKNLLIIVLIFSLSAVHAQKKPSFTNIPLATSEDYANAEASALEAANYILSMPLPKQNSAKNEAMHFLVEWMKGTPDYTFPLNEPIGTISQDNPALLVLFMAGMTKYVLENKKGKANDQEDISFNGYKILADYCGNPENKVKVTGELRNLVQSKKDGNLKDYLEEFQEEPEGKKV